jgi:DNA-directed RNA polymerase specialized sigma24 family protein
MGDVAGLLGVPEGTVKSRLHQARQRLLEKLKWAVNDTKQS